MKAVLIISYFFAPYNCSAVFRVLRLSKFLPEYGWSPHVLTIKESDGMRNVDPQLYDYIHPAVSVHRTSIIDPQLIFFRHFKKTAISAKQPHSERQPNVVDRIREFFFKYKGKVLRYFLFPDPQILWTPFAVVRGIREIKKANISAIVASGGPWTDFIIGYLLSIITGRDLILDFRDLWSGNNVVTYPSRFHRKIAEKLERVFIAHAKKVICVTELMTKGFVECYPNTADKFVTITNGFDSDFNIRDMYVPPDDRSHRDKFRMAYTGTFYLNRKPDTFLRALAELCRELPDIRSQMEFLFIGNDFQNVLNDLVSELHLSDVVRQVGFLSYSDTHLELQRADVAVLIVPSLYKEEFTGKVFEYFMAKKKILAVVPRDGCASELITRTGTGVVASVEDVGDIKNAILTCFNEWKKRDLTYSTDDGELRKYDMRTLAGRMSEVLEGVS